MPKWCHLLIPFSLAILCFLPHQTYGGTYQHLLWAFPHPSGVTYQHYGVLAFQPQLSRTYQHTGVTYQGPEVTYKQPESTYQQFTETQRQLEGRDKLSEGTYYLAGETFKPSGETYKPSEDRSNLPGEMYKVSENASQNPHGVVEDALNATQRCLNNTLVLQENIEFFVNVMNKDVTKWMEQIMGNLTQLEISENDLEELRNISSTSGAQIIAVSQDQEKLQVPLRTVLTDILEHLRISDNDLLVHDLADLDSHVVLVKVGVLDAYFTIREENTRVHDNIVMLIGGKNGPEVDSVTSLLQKISDTMSHEFTYVSGHYQDFFVSSVEVNATVNVVINSH